MFKNYLMTALNVLRRRKFLAFVNLFGVAVTLTVLIVVSALARSVLQPEGAESGHRNYLTVSNVCFRGGDNTWNSGPGWQFYQRHIASLDSPALTSFFTGNTAAITYQNGSRLEFSSKATDAAYWQILQFEFAQGRPIDVDDVAAGRAVAIINRTTAAALFGAESAVEQTVRLNGLNYRVIGVVADEPESSRAAYADIWTPLTSRTSDRWREEWLGSGSALLLAANASDRRQIQAEFRAGLDAFEYSPDPERFNNAFSLAATKVDATAAEAMDQYCSSESQSSAFFASVSALMLAFMLLPAINMVNLNVSRIMERAPEIGVRKAMGATRRTLVGQFVFENLVITAIGGLFALTAAPFVLMLLNQSLFEYGTLAVDGYVVLAAIVLIGLFGVLSGAYPAWRMARLEPTDALRGGDRRD